MFENRTTLAAKHWLNCSCLILFLFLLTKIKDYCIMIKKEKYERKSDKMTYVKINGTWYKEFQFKEEYTSLQVKYSM